MEVTPRPPVFATCTPLKSKSFVSLVLSLVSVDWGGVEVLIFNFSSPSLDGCPDEVKVEGVDEYKDLLW